MARKGDGIYRRGSAWWLKFIHKGVRHQVSLGRKISRTMAAEIAVAKRAAILKGEVGIGGKKPKDMSFKDAVKLFLQASEATNRPHTVRSYKTGLTRLGETFGEDTKLSQITPFMIEKHRQNRMKESLPRRIKKGGPEKLSKPAPVGFNRELGTLKTLINWCIDKGKFEGVNPCRKVKRFKESRGRERFLETEEEDSLLAECAEPLRTIVLVGIYAGLRIPSEALSLKWQDIDLKRSLLTIQGAFAKNGQTATLPLNPKLQEALERLKAGNSSEWVFAKEDGEPYRAILNAFNSACERAGLKGVSPHCLRHTFASRLAMNGYDVRTIQELGRWQDIRMVMRYANLSPSHKTEAIASLSEKPAKIQLQIRLQQKAENL